MGVPHEERITLAKELLDAAGGWPEDAQPIGIVTRPSFAQMAQAVASMWGQIGVDAVAQPMEATKRRPLLKSREFDAVFILWLADFADPANFYQLFEGEINISNSHWENADFDRIYMSALEEPDRREREYLYHAMEDLILTECPSTPIVHPQFALLVSERVEHAGFGPLGTAPVLPVRLAKN